MNTLRITDSFLDILYCLWGIVTPEDTFIDVGANEGLISCWMALVKKPKRIIAIEGNEVFAKPIVEENFKECERVTNKKIIYDIIYKLALDHDGTHLFYELPDSPSQSSVYDRFHVGKKEVDWYVERPCITIDSVVNEYHLKKPIVMKIDTELSEPLVWKGMKGSFPLIRAVVMEFMGHAMKEQSPHNPNDFLDEIREDGFKILNLEGMPITNERAILMGKVDLLLINGRYEVE